MRDAGCAVGPRPDDPRHAEARHAERVIGLIVSMRHDNHRPPGPDRLCKCPRTPLVDDRGGAREEQLMRSAIDEQDIGRQASLRPVLLETPCQQYGPDAETSHGLEAFFVPSVKTVGAGPARRNTSSSGCSASVPL